MGTDLPRRLGNRIRTLRNRAGVTQARLAERIDISHEFMSRLERGLKAPSLDTAERISVALGVAMPELFDFGVAPIGEEEELLAGLKSLLATADIEKLKLVVEIAKTVVKI